MGARGRAAGVGGAAGSVARRESVRTACNRAVGYGAAAPCPAPTGRRAGRGPPHQAGAARDPGAVRPVASAGAGARAPQRVYHRSRRLHQRSSPLARPLALGRAQPSRALGRDFRCKPPGRGAGAARDDSGSAVAATGEAPRRAPRRRAASGPAAASGEAAGAGARARPRHSLPAPVRAAQPSPAPRWAPWCRAASGPVTTAGKAAGSGARAGHRQLATAVRGSASRSRCPRRSGSPAVCSARQDPTSAAAPPTRKQSTAPNRV